MTPSLEQLVSRVVNGDEESWHPLWQTLEPKLSLIRS